MNFSLYGQDLLAQLFAILLYDTLMVANKGTVKLNGTSLQ